MGHACLRKKNPFAAVVEIVFTISHQLLLFVYFSRAKEEEEEKNPKPCYDGTFLACLEELFYLFFLFFKRVNYLSVYAGERLVCHNSRGSTFLYSHSITLSHIEFLTCVAERNQLEITKQCYLDTSFSHKLVMRKIAKSQAVSLVLILPCLFLLLPFHVLFGVLWRKEWQLEFGGCSCRWSCLSRVGSFLLIEWRYMTYFYAAHRIYRRVGQFGQITLALLLCAYPYIEVLGCVVLHVGGFFCVSFGQGFFQN